MKKNCLGFTLIELLVAISIIGIIFTIGLAKYNQFNRRQILVQAAREFKSNLRLVQSKALAGEKPTGCDVLSGHKLEFINTQNYKIVAVCGSDIDVKTGLTLGPNVSKTTGPSSILFKVLAQGPGATETFTLSFPGVDDVVVTVTEGGEIY